MNTAECLREFQRKYDGTFFFLRRPGDTDDTLVHCTEITLDANNGNATLSVQSVDYGMLQLNIPSGHTLVFRNVPTGVFQIGRHAVYAARRPQRQWRKGICADNTRLTVVTSELIRSSTNNFTLQGLTEVFKTQTYPFAEAVKMLEGSTRNFVSVAIGNEMALSHSTDAARDTLLLFYRTAVIGVYRCATKDFVDVAPAFQPHVRSLV